MNRSMAKVTTSSDIRMMGVMNQPPLRIKSIRLMPSICCAAGSSVPAGSGSSAASAGSPAGASIGAALGPASSSSAACAQTAER